MSQVLAAAAPEEAADEAPPEDQAGIKVTVLGRPNVGKSTLINRMLGEDRVVASDVPGTTRDSIYIPYERNGKLYTLIDTAGVRRRGRVTETVEKFSIVKTLQAIEDTHVVVLLIDASEGLVDQDMHLMGQVLDSGKGLVLALNKWDGLSAEQKHHAKSEMDRRLQFLDYVDVHYISALHGTGVGHLYRSIDKSYEATTMVLSTPKLTRILEDAVAHNAPPAVQHRRIKLRYAHQGGTSPLRIIIHGNQTEHVPTNYRRYLEKTFREALRLRGAPILLQFRTGENPFEGKRNPLSDRQKEKRRRLMKHVKSKKR
jgi:GTP-binding protein